MPPQKFRASAVLQTKPRFVTRTGSSTSVDLVALMAAFCPARWGRDRQRAEHCQALAFGGSWTSPALPRMQPWKERDQAGLGFIQLECKLCPVTDFTWKWVFILIEGLF